MGDAIGNPMNAIKKPIGAKLPACELKSGKNGSWVDTEVVKTWDGITLLRLSCILSGDLVSVSVADLEEIIRWAKGQ